MYGLILHHLAFIGPNWLWHPLGACTGTPGQIDACHSYNFWSGIEADITEITLLGAVLVAFRKINCHAPWCFRIGHHQTEDGHYKLCHKHHPDRQSHPTLAHILDSHAQAKERKRPL